MKSQSTQNRRWNATSNRRSLLRHLGLESLEERRVMAAPVLDASCSPTLGSVLYGSTNPSGVTVSAMVVDRSISDPDGQAVEAIAITRLNTRIGTHQYSLDHGASWHTIRADLINSQSNELALLLGPTARLRVLPTGNVTGSIHDAITFRAWDMSSGSQGQYTVIANPGGHSAFSIASDTASISVTKVNRAPTFRVGGGIVVERIGNGDFSLGNAAVQPDGKIVVAGTSYNGSNNDFTLTRYHADGSVDRSFGYQGVVTTDFGDSHDSISMLTIQPDGKVIAGGYIYVGNRLNFALARYHANGSLDHSFGTGGKVTTGDTLQQVKSITLQTDGKILVAGSVDLVRYNTDGSLDTQFGDRGKVSVPMSSGSCIGVLPDGKILVVGTVGSNSSKDFRIMRYHANGSLDTSFGHGGGVTTDFNGSVDYPSGFVVQPDGKIVVVGTSYVNQGSGFALARYNSNGLLDTGFGVGGKVTTRVGDDFDFAYSLAIQSDGKLLVVGESRREGSYYDFTLLRYHTDGSLDTHFGDGGRVITAISSAYDCARSVIVQPDGKILVAGVAMVDSRGVAAFARYNTNGSLDTQFGVTDTLGGTVEFIEKGRPVVLDRDVRIFDADLSHGNFNGAKLTLARHGGAHSQDVFSETGTLNPLVQGGHLVVQGINIGVVTTNSRGTLVLTFNSNATNDLVNSAMQQIAYSNSSSIPPASVKINWIFDDCNTGWQGNGCALKATGCVTVNITDDSIYDLYGTHGNDTFVACYIGDGTNNRWSVSLNGTTVFVGAIPTGSLMIDGLGGTDTLQIAGGNLHDLFQLDTAKVSINNAWIDFSNIEVLRLEGNSGNDQLLVLAAPASGIRCSFNGGSGDDTLLGPAWDNLWTINSAGGGSLAFSHARIDFCNVENLTGSTGSDTFDMLRTGFLAGSLNGGSGHAIDSLSYSTWTSNVTVNLSTSQNGNATGIRCLTSDIEMVTGGACNDTLNVFADTHIDSLTGGLGQDWFFGSASEAIDFAGTGSAPERRN